MLINPALLANSATFCSCSWKLKDVGMNLIIHKKKLTCKSEAKEQQLNECPCHKVVSNAFQVVFRRLPVQQWPETFWDCLFKIGFDYFFSTVRFYAFTINVHLTSIINKQNTFIHFNNFVIQNVGNLNFQVENIWALLVANVEQILWTWVRFWVFEEYTLKPRVINNAIRSPLRSRSALVATVVPIRIKDMSPVGIFSPRLMSWPVCSLSTRRIASKKSKHH